MSLENFISTVWSTELLVSLKKVLVFGQQGVVNTNYEGLISAAGDTVKINAIGSVTIGNYTKNTDMAAAEDLNDAATSLLIDQQKYFNFQVDDIDRVQGNVAVMGQAMQEAAYALRNVADQYIASLMVASPGSEVGTTGTPGTISDTGDAYEMLVNASVRLDEKNVPEFGRYAIVPPWFHGILLKDDRFAQSPTTPAVINTIVNGFVRRVAGMDIMVSNNVVHETAGTSVIGEYSRLVVGHQMATTYADQIIEVEAYRPHLRFADAVKGLHVYGSKVIRPEALCIVTVDRPAGS